MIVIGNNGPHLVSTNYWESELAQGGFFYLTWNAGAARLLVPEQHQQSLRDMASAQYVIVSKGKWEGRDALELLFEDGSEAPYSIHLVTEQTDRIIPEHQHGERFAFAIWAKEGLVKSLTGKYRVVDTLPCLEPWEALK